MKIKPAPNKGIPILVIDANFIRKHLFKGWPMLNRIAAIAREGKVNLCIPWIIEKEVFTGIEGHINELTGQEQFITKVRQMVKFTSNPEVIQDLCDKLENLRPQICADATKRFEHWLNSSQAERLPIQATHTEQVFNAYFAGDLPFSAPKQREHLPDAFIYKAVLELAKAGKEVWFVGEDKRLCESLRVTGKVRTYANLHPLFGELQSPFDFEQQQALVDSLPDTRALNDQAVACVRLQLRGRRLRYNLNEGATPPIIEQVLDIRSLALDTQSVLPMDGCTFLIAFESDISVRATERLISGRDFEERMSNFDVSIRGHFLVEYGEKGSAEKEIDTIELDDFEIGSLHRNSAGETVQPIVPLPKVAAMYQTHFDDIVRENRAGLIVVVGSTLRNRRLVAEHIVGRALRTSDIGLLNFPRIHQQLPTVDCGSEETALTLWEKARDTEADVIGLSSESGHWASEALEYLASTKGLVVATMKTASSRTAVVRYLTSLNNSGNCLQYLMAVAWIQDVTPETVTFAISCDSGWHDGSWEALLNR